MLAKLRRLLARPWRQVFATESDRHAQTMQEADRRIKEAEARVRRLQWETDVKRRR